MRFSGRVYKEGKWWLAEIPVLEAMTQGRSRKEALEMVSDMMESMINTKGFKVEVFLGAKNEFEVSYKLITFTWFYLTGASLSSQSRFPNIGQIKLSSPSSRTLNWFLFTPLNSFVLGNICCNLI